MIDHIQLGAYFGARNAKRATRAKTPMNDNVGDCSSLDHAAVYRRYLPFSVTSSYGVEKG